MVKNGAKHAHSEYGDLIMLVSARNIWFVVFIMLIVVAALTVGYLVAFGIRINPEGFNFSEIFDSAYFVIIGGGFFVCGTGFLYMQNRAQDIFLSVRPRSKFTG